MTRRTTVIVVLGAAMAIIVGACGGSTAATGVPASAGQPSAAPTAGRR